MTVKTINLGLRPDPLYSGAPLSQEESWLSVYQFAVHNRLTYHATEQLLDLIKIHCPPSNLCATSLHKLKKQLGQTARTALTVLLVWKKSLVI